MQPFHLAFPTTDLMATKKFFTDILGCQTGRSEHHYVDFNMYGNQVVAHAVESAVDKPCNPVDGKSVPVPHFGVVLDWNDWEELAERLRAANVEFVIEPYVRFAGKVGEQATMFFIEPGGNALEFKAFRNPEDIFKPFD